MSDKKPMTIDDLCAESHEIAIEKGWWGPDAAAGEYVDRNIPEQMALFHSEVSEALDEHRDGHAMTEIYFRDDGKPMGVPTELADVFIRIADTAKRYGIDLTHAIRIKMAYNRTRPHRHGGKVC